VIGKVSGGTGGFNRWTINGKRYDANEAPRFPPKKPPLQADVRQPDRRSTPVRLHRNSFEPTSVLGKHTAVVTKDVVLAKGSRKIAVDATPAMDGLALFHCHQQLHMDYGF
jgi:FtsP/CotA-like multicopper oxidase with cupredoxin domain